MVDNLFFFSSMTTNRLQRLTSYDKPLNTITKTIIGFSLKASVISTCRTKWARLHVKLEFSSVCFFRERKPKENILRQGLNQQQTLPTRNCTKVQESTFPMSNVPELCDKQLNELHHLYYHKYRRNEAYNRHYYMPSAVSGQDESNLAL